MYLFMSSLSNIEFSSSFNSPDCYRNQLDLTSQKCRDFYLCFCLGVFLVRNEQRLSKDLFHSRRIQMVAQEWAEILDAIEVYAIAIVLKMKQTSLWSSWLMKILAWWYWELTHRCFEFDQGHVQLGVLVNDLVLDLVRGYFFALHVVLTDLFLLKVADCMVNVLFVGQMDDVFAGVG